MSNPPLKDGDSVGRMMVVKDDDSVDRTMLGVLAALGVVVLLILGSVFLYDDDRSTSVSMNYPPETTGRQPTGNAEFTAHAKRASAITEADRIQN
jgi:hypothetical protein